MSPNIDIAAFVADFATSPLARLAAGEPWRLTARAADVVRTLQQSLDEHDFTIGDEIAIHRTATIEPGAVLKPPVIVGPRCFVAAGAYLRGGIWIDSDCTIGSGVELKSSFLFAATRIAHFNFVGDSIVGAEVNLEAGSIVCNHRNERPDARINVRVGATLHDLGVAKFGALIGDRCRVGANAVIAPGALLAQGTIVARASLLDQEIPG